MQRLSTKKIVFLAAFSASLSAGLAFGADLPSRKSPPAYVAPPPLWTGFYVGLNAGYGWDASPNVATQAAGLANQVDLDRGANLTGASTASTAGVAGASGHGFIGGAQAGYDYQWGSGFVVGLEADIQGAGIRGRGKFLGAGAGRATIQNGFDTVLSSVEHEKGVDWLGTVRARFGYLVTPTLLAYATGGLAYGGASATGRIAQFWDPSGIFDTRVQSPGGTGSYSDTRAGWTAGGGLEWMFAPNWSIKGEYLYYDLGSASWGVGPAATLFISQGVPLANAIGLRSNARFDGHIARAGLNFHFNPDSSSGAGAITGAALSNGRSASAYPSAPLWTGLYAGLTAGYSWTGSSDVRTAGHGVANAIDRIAAENLIGADTFSTNGLASVSGHGFIGGTQAGYNYQWGSSFVAGLEADIQGAGVRGSGQFFGQGAAFGGISRGAPLIDGVLSTAEHRKSVDWLGTVRARLGYLVTPALLAYATGGLAYGEVTADTQIGQVWAGNYFATSLQASGAAGYYSDTRVGWTVGGGLEWMFLPNWSLKGEYLYFDLGSAAWSPGLATTAAQTGKGGFLINAVALQSTTRFDGHIARAGVNYHFDWGAGPLSAN